MVLSNQEILSKISYEQLVEHADFRNVKNCSYTMRIGEIYEPESGCQIDLDQVISDENQVSKKRLNYIIRPAEILVIKTLERVHIPLDLCASYTALHSLASQGLQLINSSMIEPGYTGNLSCFIVNFSNEEVSFDKNNDIVKIVFYKLSSEPVTTEFHSQLRETIEDVKYSNFISRRAIKFNRTFLDIKSVEERAAERAFQSIQKGIRFGGIVVALLLFWATLEPIFNKWIYNSSFEENVVNKGVLLDKINHLQFENMELKQQLNTLKLERTSLDSILGGIRIQLDSLKTR